MSSTHKDIAIVGMATLAPNARNMPEFWDNVVQKIDCIVDVPESRWRIEDYYDPDPKTPDKTYCKRGGFIPDIDFDPLEFGLPPNILEVTDVSQLLALLVAKEALQDAGYYEQNVYRERTGVILGVGGGQKLILPLVSRLQYPVWEKALQSSGITGEASQKVIEKIKLAYVQWEENSFPGLLGNVVAGRIANRLDLGGINCVVDAACASSLGALDFAVSELLSNRCDMMLTGGVDMDNSIFMYMCFSKTPAFTKRDHVQPFDANSDGMLIGEAIGMLVLKRLADAERDGDRIYAVIKGIGSSSDGKYKSIYAPRAEGQLRALQRAYTDAGFSPATVGLIEAHGTGTVAGDLTEIDGLKQLLKDQNAAPGSVALGTVKSQIGHTKGAAGAASLIKTALALHHKVLPATLNITTPNAKLEPGVSPLYLNTETRPWIKAADSAPRRAGVSSFGFGGTNFHVVLEEYEAEQSTPYRVHSVAHTLMVSAPTTDQLRLECQRVVDLLHNISDQSQFVNLCKASETAEIPATSARLGLVAESANAASELLHLAIEHLSENPSSQTWQHPRGIFFRARAAEGQVVAMFAGQGSQYPNMGRELAVNFPIVRDIFSFLDTLFMQAGQIPLSKVVYAQPTIVPEQPDLLQQTNFAQPAIAALSAAQYRLMQQAGFQPDFVIGHSFGELTALWAAGVLDDMDYLILSQKRGQAMAPQQTDEGTDPGMMLAISGNLSGIEHDLVGLENVSLANWNSKRQIVLAGTQAGVANADQRLKARGYTTAILPVSAAFHTSLMTDAHARFAEAVYGTRFNPPTIPVYSNTTAAPYRPDPAEIQHMLLNQMLNPVWFQQEIENLYAAGGRIFIELGPRNVLTNLLSDILTDQDYVAIAMNPSRTKDSDWQFREAVMRLRVIGLHLGNVDPYQRVFPSPEAKKAKSLSVVLNGSNYVSEKTRLAYQNALVENAGQTNRNQPYHMYQEVPMAHGQETGMDKVISNTNTQPTSATLQDNLARSLEAFGTHQGELVRVYQQYLTYQAEYMNVFVQLMQQQHSLIANTPQIPLEILESMQRSMNVFHEHQAHTLHVHEQYLQQQLQITQSFLELLRQQITAPTQDAPHQNGTAKADQAISNHKPMTMGAIKPPSPAFAAPPAVKPTPPMPAPTLQPAQRNFTASIRPPQPASMPLPKGPVGNQAFTAPPAFESASTPSFADTLLSIVSEKTGYPVDTLELDMDVESDLGIDSIKRVEILATVRDMLPDLPGLDPEDLAQLRTLRQLADYASSAAQKKMVG